ncbi:RraA family protein [Oceanobacillus bengalensis]|uniref:Putative 4-hydroxy-4-methyl-2-oxoglutarate aldolase n=1 Tax=Oceanobacillus bengalensis TaxID=1435466 RepID=A0A494YZ79_9BACI|nr:RraA family protein [Oceanobacillus bengalensis]RKQ15539.1 RraA family protein [Oceanobacillus bengalensis]
MSALQLKNHSPLLPDEIISRAKKLSSTLLSDAMNGSGAMDYQIKPLTKGSFMVGTAITLELQPGDNLYLHQAIYSGQEGYVIVADGQDHKDNAYLGELMALAAETIGVEGLVIDGLVRDKKVLEALEIPIFARGFVPSGPYKEQRGILNETINCAGVTVNPGDLVFGDEDGITVVPCNLIEEVFERAEKKLAYEVKRIEVINEYLEKKERGEFPDSIEPSWLKEKIETV